MKTDVLIDLLAVAGITIAAGGVYRLFGIGWAAVFFGLGLFLLALIAARLNNATDETQRDPG